MCMNTFHAIKNAVLAAMQNVQNCNSSGLCLKNREFWSKYLLLFKDKNRDIVEI